MSKVSYCENYWTEAVSLEILLQHEGILSEPGRRSDRLKLGVQLASSVMQLHATAWLKESWGKGDIFFPQTTEKARLSTGEVSLILKPILEKPLVRRSFDPAGDKSPQKTTTKLPFVPYDKSLFSLGIILVELWFGKRLQDFPKYSEVQQLYDRTDNTDYQIANMLVLEIEREAGQIYSNAGMASCESHLCCLANCLFE